jgi:hypothetical protein
MAFTLSEEYHQLFERTAFLKKTLLPKTSNYQTKWGQDRLRAFRLLVHAEVEHYMEEICVKLLNELESSCRSPKSGSRLERIWADKIQLQQKQCITDNNGIRKENIIKMFGPLGVPESLINEVSPMLLDRLSDLGRDRGFVAHTGVSHRTTKEISLTREKKNIDEILGHIEPFDRLIIRLRLLPMLGQ